MVDCCEKDEALDALRENQSTTLKIVLAINATIFVVGIGAGIYAGSSAVLSDSLDNLGDALTYGLSLYVVYKSSRAKVMVALFKGGLILTAAVIVVAQLVYKLLVPSVPIFEVMGLVSLFSRRKRNVFVSSHQTSRRRREYELGLGVFA